MRMEVLKVCLLKILISGEKKNCRDFYLSKNIKKYKYAISSGNIIRLVMSFLFGDI